MPRGLNLLLAACVVSLASGCGSSSSKETATCASVLRTLSPVTNRGSQRATGTTIAVEGANAGFTPTCITDVPRGTVTLTMHNTGHVIHDIAVGPQHVDRDVAPGKSRPPVSGYPALTPPTPPTGPGMRAN